MLLSLRKNGLTSLFKEVRVFKVKLLQPMEELLLSHDRLRERGCSHNRMAPAQLRLWFVHQTVPAVTMFGSDSSSGERFHLYFCTVSRERQHSGFSFSS